MIGKTLNHYKIIEKIGSGGMGDVYLAEDTTLNRKIALKVLPAEVANDPDRRGRFEREAKAVAALNHPNIVTIHSIEQSDPSGEFPEALHFLTMELISGKSLSQLIPPNGMPLKQILEYGIALTEAMTAAHDKEITHRDLKPDNIMVGDDGRLKILDFGLAKLREEPAKQDRSGTELPTQAIQTEDGRILGTVAYMSPEQLEAKPVDPRSDIFSIGIILYEMATGRRPFQGETRISVISSIMRDTPTSVTELNRSLPRYLGRIIKRCLMKDPARRYGNAHELHNDLLELDEEFASGELEPAAVAAGVAAQPTPAAGNRVVLGGLLAIIALLVVVAVLMVAGRQDEEPTTSPPIDATLTQLTLLPGEETQPSLSPDGRMLVFASRAIGNWDIYFQVVGGEKMINLTEDHQGDDYLPAFSPDGRRIVFLSERQGGGIFVMGTTGESVRRVADVGYNPSWSPDGKTIVYSTEGFEQPTGRSGTGRLLTVNVDTGETGEIPYEGDAVQPAWSPNDHRIAFWGLPEGSGQRDIWTIPATGGEAVPVTDDVYTDWDPIWSPDGKFLYFSSDRGGTMNLWRVPIDEASGRVLNSPQPVTTGVSRSEYLTIGEGGKKIAYASGGGTLNLQRVAFDPSTGKVLGEPEWITRGTNSFFHIDPSPDGKWLVATQTTGQEDVVLIRIDGTGRRQLTNDPAKNRGNRWSPDGSRIAFYSDRNGSYEIWTIRPDGSGLEQLTDTPGSTKAFPSWSPDGSRIAIDMSDNGVTPIIIDSGKTGKEQSPETLPTLTLRGNYFAAFSWSPDGKKLAGTLRETQVGSAGIGIYTFETGEYRRLIDSGQFPSWLNDSRRLVYDDDGRIMLVDAETGDTRQILSSPPDTLIYVRPSADNRYLYMVRGSSQSDIWLLTIK